MRLHLKDQKIRNEVLHEIPTSQEKVSGRKKYKPKLHLLVVDDDPLFLRMVHRAADREHIAVTECGSLGEVEAVAMPGVFDVAIVDYYLDGISSNLKGPGIADRLGSTPTILVSQRQESICEGDPWPDNVRFYLNKEVGTQTLIDTALKYKKFLTGLA